MLDIGLDGNVAPKRRRNAPAPSDVLGQVRHQGACAEGFRRIRPNAIADNLCFIWLGCVALSQAGPRSESVTKGSDRPELCR